MGKANNKKISYIRKPFAARSLTSLLFAVVALACGIASLSISVALQGQGGVNVAAWGLSSMICSVIALVWGLLSFLDKEKNYLLAKIGTGTGAVLAVFWVCLVIVGLLG